MSTTRTDRRSDADAPPSSGVHLAIDPAGLEPLIRAVVGATLAALDADRAAIPDNKIAFGETEAARLLSLHVHQLRDERLRGRIQASVGPGRKVLYSRADLLGYLAGRRWEGQDGAARGLKSPSAKRRL